MKLVILLVVGAFTLFGCGSKQEPQTDQQHDQMAPEPHTSPETSAADILANDGTRKIGDVTTCPVTKDVFRISENAPTATVEGKTYYFCCKGCIKEFNADPSKFLSASTDDVDEIENHNHSHDHGSHDH